MKIVNVVDFFHPNAGYENNILPKYLVKNGHQAVIITAQLDKVPEGFTSFFGKDNINEDDQSFCSKTGIEIIRVPVKCFISGRAWFTDEIFKTVEAVSPDLLFLCGNDTLISMQFLLKNRKKCNPLILDSHMLEIASKNPFNKLFRHFYKKIFTPIIIKNKLQVIRVQDDAYVERCLGIPLNQAPFISFGSDTMLFHPDDTVRKNFRDKNGINENDFVIVYAGKLDAEKGGKLLAHSFEAKFDTDKNVVFLVVGNTNGEYGDEVEKIFKKAENRIIRFPTQRYTDLAQFYQASDLAVFFKQCSLSFYDVQACAVPVVLEDNSINIDRCSYENGLTFKSGDIDDFRDKILKLIEMGNDEYQKIRQNAYSFVKENYDYEDIVKKYIAIFEKEYSRYHAKGGNGQ
jgi:glycosyltransferase involved in cell wall biosynthesis